MITEMSERSFAIGLGLPANENHRVYSWAGSGDTVYFSAASHDQAVSIHLAAGRDSWRSLRVALNEFCEFVFRYYKWCAVIVGAIKAQSVVNLAKRCGFDYLIDVEIHTGEIVPLYARFRA